MPITVEFAIQSDTNIFHNHDNNELKGSSFNSCIQTNNNLSKLTNLKNHLCLAFKVIFSLQNHNQVNSTYLLQDNGLRCVFNAISFFLSSREPPVLSKHSLVVGGPSLVHSEEQERSTPIKNNTKIQLPK